MRTRPSAYAYGRPYDVIPAWNHWLMCIIETGRGRAQRFRFLPLIVIKKNEGRWQKLPLYKNQHSPHRFDWQILTAITKACPYVTRSRGSMRFAQSKAWWTVDWRAMGVASPDRWSVFLLRCWGAIMTSRFLSSRLISRSTDTWRLQCETLQQPRKVGIIIISISASYTGRPTRYRIIQTPWQLLLMLPRFMPYLVDDLGVLALIWWKAGDERSREILQVQEVEIVCRDPVCK